MREILNKLTDIICDYLKINEDLFFCAYGHPRIIEAKKYFSYFAYCKFKIPPSTVSGYLGVSAKRASITIDRANSVRSVMYNEYSSQTVKDIEELEKIIENNSIWQKSTAVQLQEGS